MTSTIYAFCSWVRENFVQPLFGLATTGTAPTTGIAHDEIPQFVAPLDVEDAVCKNLMIDDAIFSNISENANANVISRTTWKYGIYSYDDVYKWNAHDLHERLLLDNRFTKEEADLVKSQNIDGCALLTMANDEISSGIYGLTSKLMRWKREHLPGY